MKSTHLPTLSRKSSYSTRGRSVCSCRMMWVQGFSLIIDLAEGCPSELHPASSVSIQWNDSGWPRMVCSVHSASLPILAAMLFHIVSWRWKLIRELLSDNTSTRSGSSGTMVTRSGITFIEMAPLPSCELSADLMGDPKPAPPSLCADCAAMLPLSISSGVASDNSLCTYVLI